MTIDERRYRKWLMDKIEDYCDSDFEELLKYLYSYEFIPEINYDDDRGGDGLYLRLIWADFIGIELEDPMIFGPPNMLETLVALAGRVTDQLFGSKYMDEWPINRIFWEFMQNLDFTIYEGDLEEEDKKEIDLTLKGFVSKKETTRNISNKSVVFCDVFPKSVALKRRQKAPIWTRMHTYIREKWPI